MFIEKKHRFPLAECIIAFLVFIFHYTSLIDISIKNVSPFILLPLIVGISMYRGELCGLIFGAVCGFACDAVSTSTVCFNTLTLMFTGFLVGLLAKNIFNKNLPGAAALSLLSSAAYHFLKWFLTYFLPDVDGKVYVFLWQIIPSAIYTAAFIIPFFYLEKLLTGERKKKSKLK